MGIDTLITDRSSPREIRLAERARELAEAERHKRHGEGREPDLYDWEEPSGTPHRHNYPERARYCTVCNPRDVPAGMLGKGKVRWLEPFGPLTKEAYLRGGRLGILETAIVPGDTLRRFQRRGWLIIDQRPTLVHGVWEPSDHQVSPIELDGCPWLTRFRPFDLNQPWQFREAGGYIATSGGGHKRVEFRGPDQTTYESWNDKFDDRAGGLPMATIIRPDDPGYLVISDRYPTVPVIELYRQTFERVSRSYSVLPESQSPLTFAEPDPDVPPPARVKDDPTYFQQRYPGWPQVDAVTARDGRVKRPVFQPWPFSVSPKLDMRRLKGSYTTLVTIPWGQPLVRHRLEPPTMSKRDEQDQAARMSLHFYGSSQAGHSLQGLIDVKGMMRTAMKRVRERVLLAPCSKSESWPSSDVAASPHYGYLIGGYPKRDKGDPVARMRSIERRTGQREFNSVMRSRISELKPPKAGRNCVFRLCSTLKGARTAARSRPRRLVSP